MAKTLSQVKAIVDRIESENRTFVVSAKGDGFLLQVRYFERDVDTSEVRLQKARKWYVSAHASETEIVETAFAAAQRSALHVVAEHFTYRGDRVFSPHFAIEARVELARGKRYDVRPDDRVRR